MRPHSSPRRIVPFAGSVILLALLLALAAPAAGAVADSAADSAAARLLRESLAALGGPDALRAARGLEITARGTFDLGLRLQGRLPDVAELVPLEERVGVAFADGGELRIAHETRTRVNPDAEEWIRTIFHAGRPTLLIDRLANRAFWIGSGESTEPRQRIARAVPHLLLREALAFPERLRVRRSRMVDGDSVDVVEWSHGDNPPIDLFLDRRTRLLRGLAYELAMPVRGRTEIRWTFDAYRTVEGLGPYPAGHTIRVAGRPLRRVTYTSVRAGAGASPLFDVPEGVTVPLLPEPRPAARSEAPADSPPRPPDVRVLAPGVYLAPNIRSGFHHLFVEFADFVIVVDATAPWLELHEIPAAGAADVDGVDALGERLLAAVRAAVPGKPVRHLVLTHHHGDHAGGLRPFVQAGATVMATAPTMPIVRRIAPAARVDIVRGERTIADSTMQVRLIDVGANPHVDGMLVVWIPRQRVLYTSDLWEPLSPRNFPSPARTPVMRWFVRWLDGSGLDPEQIFAIHGSARVTPEQLATIRALPAAAP